MRICWPPKKSGTGRQQTELGGNAADVHCHWWSNFGSRMASFVNRGNAFSIRVPKTQTEETETLREDFHLDQMKLGFADQTSTVCHRRTQIPYRTLSCQLN